MELEGNDIAARVLLRADVLPQLVAAGYEAKQQRLLAQAAKEAERRGADRNGRLWAAAAGSRDGEPVEQLQIQDSVSVWLDRWGMMESRSESSTAAEFYASLPSPPNALANGVPARVARRAGHLPDQQPPAAQRAYHTHAGGSGTGAVGTAAAAAAAAAVAVLQSLLQGKSNLLMSILEL